MERGKLQLAAIQDKSKRHIAFTKRRRCLFKKAKSLCDSSGGDVAVIVLSQAGNVFGFGDPTVDGVVRRYLANPAASLAAGDVGDGAGERVHSGASGIEKGEVESLTEVEKRIGETMASGRSAWDDMVRNLGFGELDELEAAMKKIKIKVAALVREASTAGG